MWNKTSFVLNTGKGWMEHQLQGCTPVLCDRVHITENMYIIGTWPSVFNCTPMMTLKTTGVEESAGCSDVRTSNETWSSLQFTWMSRHQVLTSRHSVPQVRCIPHRNLTVPTFLVQGGSNMTGTDLCVNKPHCAAAVRPWESEATTSTLPPARVRTCLVLSWGC